MPRQPGLVDAVARLELFPPFDRAEVFSGLEGFSHVWISFVFHLCLGQQARLTVRPPRLGGNRKIGVFASRSTHRPNPIGISVVALAGIEQFNNGISLLLKGADVVDGTPVLDIKPFAPYFDVDTAHQQLEVREVNSLAEARDRIDRIDAEIIRLLGNRAGFVRQVTKFKKTTEDVRAPERYAEVMHRRRELAEAAGLDPDVVEGMYKLLVDNFIKEEMAMLRLQDEG